MLSKYRISATTAEILRARAASMTPGGIPAEFMTPVAESMYRAIDAERDKLLASLGDPPDLLEGKDQSKLTGKQVIELRVKWIEARLWQFDDAITGFRKLGDQMLDLAGHIFADIKPAIIEEQERVATEVHAATLSLVPAGVATVPHAERRLKGMFSSNARVQIIGRRIHEIGSTLTSQLKQMARLCRETETSLIADRDKWVRQVIAG